MALTVNIPFYSAAYNIAGVASGENMKYVQFVGDTSYPNGGYAVTTGTFSFFTQVAGAQAINPVTSGWICVYDQVFKTIRFLQTPGSSGSVMVEATSGQNLSAISVNSLIWGW